jgi:hypothetical protein
MYLESISKDLQHLCDDWCFSYLCSLSDVVYSDEPHSTLTRHLRVEKDDTVRISNIEGEWVIARVVHRMLRGNKQLHWDMKIGRKLRLSPYYYISHLRCFSHTCLDALLELQAFIKGMYFVVTHM